MKRRNVKPALHVTNPQLLILWSTTVIHLYDTSVLYKCIIHTYELYKHLQTVGFTMFHELELGALGFHESASLRFLFQ